MFNSNSKAHKENGDESEVAELPHRSNINEL